jgi:apolipoprotein N-acyltransferase
VPRERRITSRRFFLAVLSGVLFALSFPPADLGILAWIALVPLLLSIDGVEPRRAFRFGYLGGFTACLLVVSWLRVYGLPVWLLLSAYLALQFAAFAGAYRWIAQKRPAWIGIAAVPLLWTSLEYLRSSGPFGFPWALLGLSQHTLLPVIQVAQIAGVFGVSCLVALGSALFFSILKRRFDTATIVVILIAVTVGWGSREVQTRPAASTQVAALQPNVDPKAKFDPVHAGRIMADLERLTQVAAERDPELIVFPETAVPRNLFGPAGALPDIGRWANIARTTLIASSLENGQSNIAVAVAASGQAVDRYDKVRLVAFGEAGIQPGIQHRALWTPAGSVGVAICFESIFPEASRTLTRNGARVLAIITNDAVIATNSALDRWSGPEQHAAHSVLRAVETGRWVIRAANTGLTRLIDPSGRIRGEIPRGQTGVLTGQVALKGDSTIYVSRGDLFAVGALVVSVLLSLPAALPWLAAQWRRQPFQQAAAGTLLPLITVSVLLRSHLAAWVWTAVLIAFVAIFSLTRRPSTWGLARRGAMSSVAMALGMVVLLWLLIASAYRAQQIPILLMVPASGWLRFAAGQLILAGAIESWLRGYAFSALADSVGAAWTIALTTLLGVLLQTGLRPEAYAWAICTGVAFGLIRARTGNVLGPVAGHALGNVLISAITFVR